MSCERAPQVHVPGERFDLLAVDQELNGRDRRQVRGERIDDRVHREQLVAALLELIADLPDFEYCSAFGTTAEEALVELRIAKDAWLAAAREKGDPIPEPRYRPLQYLIR